MSGPASRLHVPWWGRILTHARARMCVCVCVCTRRWRHLTAPFSQRRTIHVRHLLASLLTVASVISIPSPLASLAARVVTLLDRHLRRGLARPLHPSRTSRQHQMERCITAIPSASHDLEDRRCRAETRASSGRVRCPQTVKSTFHGCEERRNCARRRSES